MCLRYGPSGASRKFCEATDDAVYEGVICRGHATHERLAGNHEQTFVELILVQVVAGRVNEGSSCGYSLRNLFASVLLPGVQRADNHDEEYENLDCNNR